MKIRFYIYFLIFYFIGFKIGFKAQAPPTFSWVVGHSTAAGKESSYSLAVDSINKVIYTCGYIENASAFAGLLSTEMNFGVGNGNADGYLAKHDFNGTLLWVVNMGSNNNDETRGVSFGIDGNIYITGICDQNAVNFKSIGSPNFTLTANSNLTDVFIASYTSNGKLRWVRRGGGAGNDFADCIISTPKGICVMGTYKNSASFGTFSTNALYNTKDNYFIVNYTFNGTENWLTEAKSDADDGNSVPFIYGRSKMIYSNDTIFLIGEMAGDNMTFINNGGGAFGTVLTSAGNNQIFYAALANNGAWIWAQRITATGNPQHGFGIAADCGGLYISGAIHLNSVFPSASVLASADHDNPFMARCTRATGIDTWRKKWTSTANVNHEQIARNLFADGHGYLYVAGNHKSANFFAPDGNLGTVNGVDNFIAKYRTDGTFVWVQAIKGTNDNYLNDFTCTENKIIVCGQFNNDITLTPLASFSGFANENAFLGLGNLTTDVQLYNCCSIPPTIAMASANQSVCATNSTVVTGNIPTSGYGYWHVVEGAGYNGTGGFANPLLTTNTLTGFTQGQNMVTWVISKNFCNPSIDSVKVSMFLAPTSSTAGSNQTICINNPTTTISGNVPTIGSGLWTFVSGSGTIVTPTAAVTSVTALATGTNILQWSITNGVCSPSTSTLAIIVNALPTTAIAGTNQVICATTATLASNTPTIGTGNWSLLSGTVSITSPSSTNSGLIGIAVGTHSLVWSISNGVCPASTSTVLIQRDAVPTTAVAGTNQVICAATATLASNTPTIGTGNWSLLSGTVSITSPTSTNSGLTGIAVGTHSLVWSISNGVCPASTSTVLIQRDDFPTTAVAGTNQVICATTATLASNTPSTGTGNWSLLSGTVSITTPTNTNSGLTGIAVGTHSLVWSISNGVCPASTSTVLIQRDALPTTAVAGTNQVICASTATLASNTPTIGTGNWSLLSGTVSITSPTSTNSGLTGIAVGTHSLVWSISNGVCPASTSTVLIQRDALPTTAVAGTNQVICASTATLASNTPTIGTGNWSLLSGTVSITSPTSTNSGLTGIAVGTHSLVWSISNGVCPASTSTVLIQRDALPTTAIAGTNQVICATTATLASNTPTIGTGNWSLLSGTVSITSPTSTNSGLTGIAVGTHSLVWSISNGVCPASTSTVLIQRDALPTTAVAGTNQVICASTATLASNTPTIGTGNWSLLSGTVSITSPTSTNSGLTGIAVGTHSLVWSISNGVCPASTSTVLIQRDALPTTAVAGTNQVICASTATLASNTPTIGTGNWSLLSGTVSITSPTSTNSGLTGIAVGTHSLVWSISNGVCPASTSTVLIQRDALPTTAIAGTNQVICATTATLASNTPTIGTGNWSLLSGTVSITSPTSTNSGLTGIAVGTHSLVWSISNGVCPASTSTVLIQRDALPTTAVAGTNQVICASTATLASNTPTIGTGNWSLLSGTVSITSPTSTNSGLTGIAVGTHSLVWSISNGVCPASTSTVLIQRDALPTTAIAGTNQVICASTATLASNTPTIGTGNWSLLSGTVSITSPTSTNSGLTGIAVGTHSLVWSISNGVCPASTSAVSIQRDDFPTAANAGPDISICSPSFQLTGNSISLGIGKWDIISSNGVITDTLNPSSLISNLNVGLNQLVWSTSNLSCPVSRDTIEISRDLPPTIAVAGSDTITGSNKIYLNANTPLIGFGTWSIIEGGGNFSNINDPKAIISDLVIGKNELSWKITNGVCPESDDRIIITEKGLFIPQLISPNNDGVNDNFFLNAIENYSFVKIEIFDRWGKSVYKNDNYGNDFNGLSSSGKPLVDDTYFIILEFPNEKPYTGNLVIKRK